jgi:hypothetical protein
VTTIPTPEEGYRVTFHEVSWCCDRCGRLVDAGTPGRLDGLAGPYGFTHAACPRLARWTPEVIEGEECPQGQLVLALVFLTPVPS